MNAEIISVGTELLLGHTINSDAAWVARELSALGIDLHHIQTVGDNPVRLLDALNLAANRSDIIITTGGLGPTKDDITKEIVSEFIHKPLEINEICLKQLKKYFGSQPISENQYNQAFFPKEAIIFPNENGTAPGCAIPFGKQKFVILLPGPPSELLPMLKNHVHHFLMSLNDNVIYSSILRVFGMGEGMVAEKLGEIFDGDNPTVATYAGDGEMSVKITAKASNMKIAQAMVVPVITKIKKILGDVVYGENISSLASLVVSLLQDRRKTIATAESCTGGLLAKRITDQPGASNVFNMGLVTYSNEAKIKLLHISEEVLDKYGAVSHETAISMAQNIRDISGGDLGIGITGIAGPDGGTSANPVGLVHIALSVAQNDWEYVMRPKGKYLGRDWVRLRASNYALDMIRRYLMGLSMNF